MPELREDASTGGVHSHLVGKGLRSYVSLIVRSAECLDTHGFAVLVGYVAFRGVSGSTMAAIVVNVIQITMLVALSIACA